MSEFDDPVRWGILGTAGIAESAFLPALQDAGDGTALIVASREAARAETWAADHGVARGVQGYGTVIEDPEVEAIYVPLPNGLHAEWTVAALEAGKTVLCEKPLCGTVEDTERVLAAARSARGSLWEAFVFPFHDQMERVSRMLAAGDIGDVREINARFHFILDDPNDIRLFADLAGGSIQDVGCYPIRLARLLFEAEPDLTRAIADAEWTPDGADTEMWGALSFAGDRRLVYSCGFRSGSDAMARVLGTKGEIRMTHPYHPGASDRIDLLRDDQVVETHAAAPSMTQSFAPAIRHIHRVVRGLEQPQHLAVDEALGNAKAIGALLDAARART
jgi:predicted dehydrogenase